MGVTANESTVSAEKMLAATGKHPDDWFSILDAQNATTWTHTAIARWLSENFDGVDGWWCQSITIRYEQARGMRAPGQKADGTFSAASTKTVRAAPGEVFDAAIREVSESLSAQPTSINAEARTPNARWKLEGRQRVLLTVTPGLEDRVSIGLTHSGIPDGNGVAPAKDAIAELLARSERWGSPSPS